MEKKFYEMNHRERLDFLKRQTGLNDDELEILSIPHAKFGFENANKMVENAIGIMSFPLGIATNFLINGIEYLIPMAIEEPSVIAAASKAAKIARKSGGFIATLEKSEMIGQVQVIFPGMDLSEIECARKRILENKEAIIQTANSKSRSVRTIDVQIRHVEDESRNKMGKMLIVELIVVTGQAMGANAINTMCEAVAPLVEDISGGKVVLKILSNYATRRIVRCKATFIKEEIGGNEILERILYAYAFAYSDPHRAVTHNKGIMNGIDAVALATGQDFRAIESAAHAFAARDGKYRSLTSWYKNSNGDLVGEIEVPLAVGIIGGVVSVHPLAIMALKIMKITSSEQLAYVMASAGLAQNLAAILALASEGIQKGHMKLHAKNIAAMAGAQGQEIDKIAKLIYDEGNISITRARELLEKEGTEI